MRRAGMMSVEVTARAAVLTTRRRAGVRRRRGVRRGVRRRGRRRARLARRPLPLPPLQPPLRAAHPPVSAPPRPELPRPAPAAALLPAGAAPLLPRRRALHAAGRRARAVGAAHRCPLGNGVRRQRRRRLQPGRRADAADGRVGEPHAAEACRRRRRCRCRCRCRCRPRTSSSARPHAVLLPSDALPRVIRAQFFGPLRRRSR